MAERDDGVPKRLQSWCSCCQRIHQRVRQGIERRGRPYEARTPSRLGIPTGPNGYEPQTEEEREIYRAYQRERHANRTPEQVEDQREYQRFYAEVKRRRNGSKKRRFKRLASPRPEGHGQIMFDSTPFLRWLDSWLKMMSHHDGQHINKDGYKPVHNLTQLAEVAGISPRSISHARVKGRVSLDTVDRVMTAAGAEYLVYVLYPLDE